MNQRDLFDASRTTRPPDGWTPDAPPELRGEKCIRLDAETDGLEWWNGSRPVGWAWLLPESGRRGYLSFGHKGGGNSTDNATALEWAKRELRNIHIDNANTKFDGHIAREWGADLVAQGCTFGDVAHRAALLDDHRFRFGLDQLAKDFLGVEIGKVQLDLTDKGLLHTLPAWEVARYAVHDVELVDDLVRVTQPEIIKQELERVLALEEQIIPVVMEMERNGVFLDMDLLAQWLQQSRAEYDDIMLRIYRAAGFHLSSPDSNKDIARLFKALSIPITSFTGALDKAGNPKPSFTREVLQRIDHPVIKDLLYAGELADLESKYLGKYSRTVRADGWIRFNLHQLRVGKSEDDKKGTVSGRFSSAGDDYGGFNVQQVVSADKQLQRGWCPKYVVRRLFKPAAGCTWLASDAKQIEYRIFAHFAEDPEIMAAYAGDPETDYHNVVQALLQTVKPDIQRKKTKITNFCKLFGAAILKFALTLETISEQQFSDLNLKYEFARWGKKRFGEREAAMRAEPALQEAYSVTDAYDRMFPSAKVMLDLAKSTAKERGFVKTLLGRRARFPKHFGRQHSALNRVVQGTAADINKIMLVAAYERRHEFGLTMRFTVHDELDCDLKDPGMLPILREWFNEQRLPLKVPILWDVSTGASWADAKGKA